MAQIISFYVNNQLEDIKLPDPEQKVTGNLKWGKADMLFTPAYWASQTKILESKYLGNFKFGKTLEEEIVACILGGYGFKAELGLLAFKRLKEIGLFSKSNYFSAAEISEILKEPFKIGARSVKYRFVNQKSTYVYYALKYIRQNPPKTKDPIEFRNWLLNISGIGLKTASWITRNWLESDLVAIIDIHIYRAGILSEIFSKSDKINRDYLLLEKKLIEYSKAIGARVSALDATMWGHMRSMPHVVSRIFNT
ncbi:MAG: 8-oxoguanine DNA glycosylase [Ignavibacteria bacterium]|jgi:thermostable 8-oxoguanine DNA glycosylase|nr:8-oxoguanine DNA glycosylase [Ignavibacteria bacterium]MCU7503781.1 8-oxoguanine DNA glycosylase [Ignavibacteria bacterium]MCU7517205.1 8-oxoguanine DNA glycosylase [Ignavibacteria bacterium]